MKTDIETLQNSFWLGWDAYEDSRNEARRVWDMYHNRQWSDAEINTLDRRGQPKETFNVIKLFSRVLVGYYSTVINTVKALPVQPGDQTIASILTDTCSNIFESNRMNVEGDRMKLGGLISGLICSTCEPIYTDKRDKFGRPIYKIELGYVDEDELVLDPMSKKEDYSDARFLHHYRWTTEEVMVKYFGRAKVDQLMAYYDNMTDGYQQTRQLDMQGRYRVFNNYLLVRTVIEDDDGKRWDIYWSNDTVLYKKEITTRQVRWPYRIQKLQSSNIPEYYGIFREIVEPQRAINQAIIKLNLMANTQKVFVEKAAVGEGNKMTEFTDAVNRVSGVIPVLKLSGVKVENLNAEALKQYEIIDRSFDRIKKVLNINDSFLGMAYASDSGRKVKLQSNASIMALRYISVRLESFYELLGRDIINLVKQYFTAHQVLRVSDELVGQRFIELNKPVQIFSGEFDNSGQPLFDTMYEMVRNPDDGEPVEDDQGNLVFAPIPEEGTEIAFTDVDVTIEAAAYNDEDERSQLILENFLASNPGQMLAQVNPAGYFKMQALWMRTQKTKFSPEMADILNQTAVMIGGNVPMEEGAALLAQGPQVAPNPRSQQLKLPQNTNEGAGA